MNILIILFFLLCCYVTWWIIKKYDSWITTKQSIKDKTKKRKIISGLPLGNLIAGFIVILVSVVLIPTVADEINVATTGGNQEDSTNKSSTILNLVKIFFALGILMAGISLAVSGWRRSGLL